MHYLHTVGYLGENVIKDRLRKECGLPARKAGSVLRAFNAWKKDMEDGKLSSFDLSTKARMALSHRGIRTVSDFQSRNLLDNEWDRKLPKNVKSEITRLFVNLGIEQM